VPSPRRALLPPTFTIAAFVIALAPGALAPAAASGAALPAGLGESSLIQAGEVGRFEAREQRRQEREQRRQTRIEAREQRRHEREGGASGAPIVPSETAREGARHLCRLSVEASPSRLTAGEGTTVSGKLLCPVGVAVDDVAVHVFRAGSGTPRSQIGSARTQADGGYQLAITELQSNAMLSVRALGARGARVAIKVAPKVTLVSPALAEPSADGGPAHLASRTRATFSGSVTPASAGTRVALQATYAPSGEHWRTVALGRVDALGDYAIVHAFRAAGEVWVRVRMHARHHNVAAVSEPVPYELVARQNPDLSIDSSSPLVAFAETVTISGVAAAPAGEQVALLARGAGGSFAQVASTTTDAAGRYSFTQTPERTTMFHVRDGHAQSTTLYEAVSYGLTPEAAPTATVAGQTTTFTGTLAPASSGHVQLERRYSSGFAFHPIASGSVADCRYSIAYTFASSGSYVLRVKAATGMGLQSASSEPFTLQVTP
jgi:hypothetical protein